MVKNISKKPSRLPEKLTISFPIWGLYDSDGKGVYADLDKFMREHVERGFNCIRLDDGAGLMHDKDGNRLLPVEWGWAFGDADDKIRQNVCVKGKVDVYARLIALFEAAKKYNVYVILTSFFYLHTYWYLKDRELNDSLLAIPPHERYERFGKYLHYIICELEKKGLDDMIAFAEIFNEADGLSFCGGYVNKLGFSDEERVLFRIEHEKALELLKAQHPQILFAVDISRPSVDENLSPINPQVFNFHSYFMWAAYSEFERNLDFLVENSGTEEAILNDVNYPELFPNDWKRRIWFYKHIDPQKIKEADDFLAKCFIRDRNKHKEKLGINSDIAEAVINGYYNGCLAVCGEGVSYCGSYSLRWEENCPEYWELLKEMALRYRKMGLWGSVVRTCCGPEDPSWYTHPEKYIEINNIFLGRDEK